MPSFHERTNRGYTWQIVIKSSSRETLREALLPFSRFHIELDPLPSCNTIPRLKICYNNIHERNSNHTPILVFALNLLKSTKSPMKPRAIIQDMVDSSLAWEKEHPYELSAAMAAPSSASINVLLSSVTI